MSKSFSLFLSPLALALAAPAVAQAPAPAPSAIAGFNVGATVHDTAGAEVGSVTKVDAQTVTVKTDKHEVPVPRASFTAAPNGLLFGMTRDQLNAAVDAQLAAAAAKVAVGATVTSAKGGTVGTIEAIDDQYVTVKLTSGTAVRLPRAAVGGGATGAVVALSAAELEAAAKAAAPAAPPAAPSPGAAPK
jgi:preprotein translocase subunit YajC